MINKIQSDIFYVKYRKNSNNLNTYKIKYKNLDIKISKEIKRLILHFESEHKRSNSFLFRKDFYKINCIK